MVRQAPLPTTPDYDVRGQAYIPDKDIPPANELPGQVGQVGRQDKVSVSPAEAPRPPLFTTPEYDIRGQAYRGRRPGQARGLTPGTSGRMRRGLFLFLRGFCWRWVSGSI
jgi:hypothetical protein